MSSTVQSHRHNNREAGMVAIMVTLILMIVISLIVLGFAQVSRRNQRQALDRQLSTQAFYAAETGVNDVRDRLEQALAAGNAIYAKPDCGPGAGAAAAFYAPVIAKAQLNTEVKYSCFTVDPSPDTLVYSDIGTTSTIVPIISGSGSNLSTVRLAWQTKDNTTTPANNCPTTANNVFSTTSNWLCGYGVLRVDLVPVDGTYNAATLQSRTMTSFMVPVRTGGTNSVAFATGGGNNRPAVRCTNTDCNVTITGLSSSQYYMRVSSLYKNVSLRITATDSSGAVGLQGAQAVIDSTGKAQDVLRRIQVHVPLTESTQRLSDYAIESTDSVCKRFSVMGGYFGSAVTGVTSTNPLCQP